MSLSYGRSARRTGSGWGGGQCGARAGVECGDCVGVGTLELRRVTSVQGDRDAYSAYCLLVWLLLD